MTAIPIRNIYYLLSYAWDLLEEADELAVETENLPRVEDLLARLLVHGTRRLLRRGIDQNFIPQSDILATVRGRIDFEVSTRRLLLKHGKVQCNFEEFLPDLLHNRILKETLKALGTYSELDSGQRAEIKAVLRRMEGISPLHIRKSHFAQVRLHKNNAHYRLLMHICELVHDNLLVNEEKGTRFFRDFLRDKRQMAKLFEHFVARFYRKEIGAMGWTVKPQEHIPWDSPVQSEFLPQMHADTILRGEGRVVVVECKFYKEMLQSSQRSSVAKIRSSHLYQLMTYLRNLEASLTGQEVEGLLVYPAVQPVAQPDFGRDMKLSGHPVRVCTINLARQWKDVAERMHQIMFTCHGEIYEPHRVLLDSSSTKGSKYRRVLDLAEI
jgi:5-methylcytosine-specific restriction enzyme subunit McrC